MGPTTSSSISISSSSNQTEEFKHIPSESNATGTAPVISGTKWAPALPNSGSIEHYKRLLSNTTVLIIIDFAPNIKAACVVA